MTLEEVAALQHRVLLTFQCRCQMVGGPMWHLRAKMEVASKCSVCKAIDAYNELTNGKT